MYKKERDKMGNENIEKLTDEELIKEYFYILKDPEKIREYYETTLLENEELFRKYLESEDYKLDISTWIVTRKIYLDLSKELIRRGYGEYADIVWGRYFKE